MFIKTKPKKVKISQFKKVDDCTINGLGTALNISYDLARKVFQTFESFSEGEIEFRKKGPKKKSEFILMGNVENICSALSEEVETFGSKNPMNLKEFSEKYSEGTYLTLVQGHLSVVKNGDICDSWDSGERMMVYCYKVDVMKAQEKLSKLASFYKMNNSEHFYI